MKYMSRPKSTVAKDIDIDIDIADILGQKYRIEDSPKYRQRGYRPTSSAKCLRLGDPCT